MLEGVEVSQELYKARSWETLRLFLHKQFGCPCIFSWLVCFPLKTWISVVDFLRDKHFLGWINSGWITIFTCDVAKICFSWWISFKTCFLFSDGNRALQSQNCINGETCSFTIFHPGFLKFPLRNGCFAVSKWKTEPLKTANKVFCNQSPSMSVVSILNRLKTNNTSYLGRHIRKAPVTPALCYQSL